MNQGKDEDLPRLNVLLCESVFSVYISLLIHSLATFDANVLFRLVNQKFDGNLWKTLFGGGFTQKVTVITKADENRKL